MERSYTRREISRRIPSVATVPSVSGTQNGNVKKSRRARPLPPNVNARNLSIEKQRREAMNKQLLVRACARLLIGRCATLHTLPTPSLTGADQQRYM